MNDLDASESGGQSAWDLFPSEQSDGGGPALQESSAAALEPEARATAGVTSRALPERESLRQWIVATAFDLLITLAIAMARVSNAMSAIRLPRGRVVAGGIAVMGGTMLAAFVLVLTGSPGRVGSTTPEMMEATVAPPRVETVPVAREISSAAGMGASQSRRPATSGVTTSNVTSRASAGISLPPSLPPKSPRVREGPRESDGTSGVPRSSPAAIASTIATVAASAIDLPAVPAPVASRPEETAVATSMTSSPTASPPPVVPPGAGTAVPAAPPVRPRSAAVQRVLNRYRDAFNALDPAAAKAVWPSADTKGLGKAFDRLQEQQMVLDRCNISVIGARAVASCEGTLRYVPSVGSRSARVQRGRWDFTLHEVGDDWTIETVKAR
jgi:hypothetical protein